MFRYLFCLDKRDLPQSILNWLVNYGSLVSSVRENAIKELSTLGGNCRKLVTFSKAFVDTMDKSYMKFTQFHMDILKELDNENGVVRSPYFTEGCYVAYSIKNCCLTLWVFQENIDKHLSIPTYYICVSPKDKIKDEGHQLDSMIVPLIDGCIEVNLQDSFMPQILAWLLYTSFSTGERRIDKLTEMITEANPMGFPMTVNTKHYEAKVKRLLMDFALGMLPGQPWEQADLASGVLVVKPSGDIDCYHVLYKDTLEEYLYHDLKFETASATRHDFASIKTDSHGNQYFTLNLQLRFIQ